MINKRNWLVILTMVLLFGVSVVGVLNAQTDSRLNGTWVFTSVGAEIEMSFKDGNYEESFLDLKTNDKEFRKGTYVTNNGILTLKPTHIKSVKSVELGLEPEKWHTMNEFMIAMSNKLAGIGIPQDTINEIFAPTISPSPKSYSIEGSSLTIRWLDGDKEVYKKK